MVTSDFIIRHYPHAGDGAAGSVRGITAKGQQWLQNHVSLLVCPSGKSISDLWTGAPDQHREFLYLASMDGLNFSVIQS